MASKAGKGGARDAKQVHNIPQGYCVKCAQVKDMERFYWLRGGKGSGMAWRCKSCSTPTSRTITRRVP